MADSNTLLSTAMITYEAAAVLMNNLVLAGKINRQYSDQFAQSGAKIGDQIHIRIPPRFIVGDGPVVMPQNITESYVTLTLNHQLSLALNYTSKDLTLSMDNFRDRFIKPAAVEVANELDRITAFELYSAVYANKGTPGTMPNDSGVFLDAKARLLDEATPDDDEWCAVITPRMQASMVKTLQGLYNAQAEVSRQYMRGGMGNALGFNWYVDQNMPAHTIGALGGTPQVNLAGQTGTTLNTKGWTATTGAVKKGDIFTIQDVYMVNPKSRRSTGELRQFTVTADTNADGSGNMAIPIRPAITPVDALGNVVQYQTVNVSPANNAPLTLFGSANTVTQQGLCFHPNFATLGFADLVMPKVGEAYRIQDPGLNISMRVWEASDFINDIHGVRLDLLFGVIPIYPSWAVRISG